MSKKNVKSGILLIVIALVVLGALALYAAMLDNRLSKETKETIADFTEQNALTIQTEIKSQETSLIEIAERLGDAPTFSPEKAIEIMKKIEERYTFKRMGVILPDGVAYGTDDTVMDLSERDYFLQSMQGENCISGRLEDYLDGGSIIVFSAPIYIEGKIEGVLFATYSPEILKEILAVTSFKGASYSYIIRKDGSLMVGRASDEGVELPWGGDNKLKRDYTENTQAIKTMKDKIAKNQDGNAYFDLEKDIYIHYTSLGINDWYLLNIIPTEAMNLTKSYVLDLTYILSCTIVLVFSGFVWRIVHLEKQKNRELENILYVDPVTGGDTYQRFKEKVCELLSNTNKKLAIIMMDIDDFKLINEMYGYQMGDNALNYISSVWQKSLTEPEAFARRIADRYTVIMFYEDEKQLGDRIKKFIKVLKEESPEDAPGFILKPRFGAYLISDKTEKFHTMQNYAVIAHSIAKRSIGVEYVIYDGGIKEEMLYNKVLQDQMEQAYIKREFIVYYQPKFDAETTEIVGAEALIRWQRPDGTLVPPFEFILVAEKSGFISALDEYVFEEVCEQQKRWMDMGFDLKPISVNISREHLKSSDFVQRYQQIREEKNIPEFSIELEITESAMFENQEEFVRIMEQLRALKFKILMDDFGTGYSSLTMLKTMPIDVIKLDKGFIDDYNDPRGEKVIATAIRLAKLMNISVTAEGVETKEQYEFLRSMQCDVVQGFYFAKPMPLEAFTKLLYNC